MAKSKGLYPVAFSEASDECALQTFTDEEKCAFVHWINFYLEKDPDVMEKLPISKKGTALYKAVGDGIILCKLINVSVPGTIDERVINRGELNKFSIYENLTLAINSASSIGCHVLQIGPQDLIEGQQQLILGLLWQIIKIGLLATISLDNYPALACVLEDSEQLSDLLGMSPEELLVHWFNYQLKKSDSHCRVVNFSKDIMDSVCYIILLNKIAPKKLGVDMSPLKESDLIKRATLMLNEVNKIGCINLTRPKDVVDGNPHLNLALVATLFKVYPALPTLEPMEVKLPDELYETPEEKVFRNWMNSLGVNPFINNIYYDLRDGYAILQLFDSVKPGCVDWTQVNKPPFNTRSGNMKKLENCNYAVCLARNLGFSVVGIAGSDLQNGSKLTLCIVWQLMKAYSLAILKNLCHSEEEIEQKDILEWVNTVLVNDGKRSTITSFKDPSMDTSYPVLDLIDCLRPGKIDYDIVNNAMNLEDRMYNARYAISMARKIGAVVYAQEVNLVEIEQNMVLTIFASLMSIGTTCVGVQRPSVFVRYSLH